MDNLEEITEEYVTPKVKINFKNGLMIETELNGNCYIVDSKPKFPSDLSEIIVIEDDIETVIHNAEILECASVDGRYWFAFRELTEQEIAEIKKSEMITDAWNNEKPYMAGMFAIENDTMYEAIFNSKGLKPSENPTYWKPRPIAEILTELINKINNL